MSILIADYQFEGPFRSFHDIKDRPGVYAILCILEKGGFYVVDIGEGAELRKKIGTHSRKECWVENCKGSLSVAVLYTPDLDQPGRTDIEKMIRARDYVPCGGEEEKKTFNSE